MTLLRLAYRCTCGTRPNLRVSPDLHMFFGFLETATEVGTWECQRCGETHTLRVEDVREAEAMEEAS